MTEAPRKKKSQGAAPVPNPANRQLRDRLLFLRMAKKRNRSTIETFTQGPLTNYELHDITPLRFGDLWNYAVELGYNPVEFISSLISAVGEEAVDLPEESRYDEILVRYLRVLDDPTKELVLNIIRSIQEYKEPETALNTFKRVNSQAHNISAPGSRGEAGKIDVEAHRESVS